MNLDARIILESTLQVPYVFISGACLFLLGRKAIELHYLHCSQRTRIRTFLANRHLLRIRILNSTPLLV